MPRLPSVPKPIPKPIAAKIETLAARASQLGPIATPKEYATWAEHLKAVRDLRRTIEAHYSKIKVPLNALKATVLSMEKADLQKVTACETTIARILTAYRDRQEQERVMREALARQAATDAAEVVKRSQVQTLEAAADAAGNPAAAAALRRQAEAVAMMPILPAVVPQEPAIPAVTGLHYRETWTATVTDLKALVAAVAKGIVPLSAVQANLSWLHQQAASLRQDLRYPGVVATPSTGIVTRRAGG